MSYLDNFFRTIHIITIWSLFGLGIYVMLFFLHLQKRVAIPKLGSNSAAPPGYLPKKGAGKCQCRNSGRGLDSCGELCCFHSPYTASDPNDKFYYGNKDPNNWQRHKDNLCWKQSPVSFFFAFHNIGLILTILFAFSIIVWIILLLLLNTRAPVTEAPVTKAQV